MYEVSFKDNPQERTKVESYDDLGKLLVDNVGKMVKVFGEGSDTTYSAAWIKKALRDYIKTHPGLQITLPKK